MSLGGSYDTSSSQSQSESSGYNEARTYLAPYQADLHRGLAGAYSTALEGYQGSGVGDMARGAANYAGQIARSPVAGMAHFAKFAGQTNPYLDQQIGNMGADMARQFGVMNQQLGGQSQLAGQRGSSRQGIAQGMLANDVMEQYQRGVTDMRSNAYGMQQNAAQNFVGAELTARDQKLRALDTSLGGVGQYAQNTFMPFAIGSQVLGMPSVLSEAYGENSSSSSSSSSSYGASAEGGLW